MGNHFLFGFFVYNIGMNLKHIKERILDFLIDYLEKVDFDPKSKNKALQVNVKTPVAQPIVTPKEIIDLNNLDKFSPLEAQEVIAKAIEYYGFTAQLHKALELIDKYPSHTIQDRDSYFILKTIVLDRHEFIDSILERGGFGKYRHNIYFQCAIRPSHKYAATLAQKDLLFSNEDKILLSRTGQLKDSFLLVNFNSLVDTFIDPFEKVKPERFAALTHLITNMLGHASIDNMQVIKKNMRGRIKLAQKDLGKNLINMPPEITHDSLEIFSEYIESLESLFEKKMLEKKVLAHEKSRPASTSKI